MANKYKPSASAMRTAAEWLDVNEGKDGESSDCKAVAEWLRSRANSLEISDSIDAVLRIVPHASRRRARSAVVSSMKSRGENHVRGAL